MAEEFKSIGGRKALSPEELAEARSKHIKKVVYYHVICGYSAGKIGRSLRLPEVRIREWLREEGIHRGPARKICTSDRSS